MQHKIIIRGAREHNLKNIDLELPRDRLIVFSGLSGSGKSSLAFDTIFAEGQRRYVESLSSYARQFLGRLEKPDVDYIEGLSPAIAIEQRSAGRNPRSTVGTVTEIYDYLRLLYARIGLAHCPECGAEIQEQAVDTIIDAIVGRPEGTAVTLLGPVVKGRKGEHKDVLDDARRAGFVRVRVDGDVVSLDDEIRLDKRRAHTIEIVVDRLRVGPDVRKRASESVETALEVGAGKLIALVRGEQGETEELYSQSNACPRCGFGMPEMQPRLFSFNSPFGACPACSGLGVTMDFDADKVIPDRSLSFNQGGIAPYNPKARWYRAQIESVSRHLGFDLDTPLSKVPARAFKALLHGTKDQISYSYVNARGGKWEYESAFRGVLNELKRRYLESTSEGVKEWLETFMSQRECPDCGGRRLKKEALAVTVGGRSIHEVTTLAVKDASGLLGALTLTANQEKIARQVLKEIQARLGFLQSVGLDYLTLERKAATLSGGEAQRIRLATQIGSSLVGVLYVLDEPTIGLHQRDNDRLLATLLHLRDIGNTLLVVEHDEQTLRSADYIVDLGPGAGVHGGRVVAQGTPAEVMAAQGSLTGQYLAGRLSMDRPPVRRPGNGSRLHVRGAAEHNLKNIDVAFPLGTFTAITGVSGSGKSSLLADVLYPALANRVAGARLAEGHCRAVDGIEAIDKVISIDQSPIGRTPRSNPATYVGLFGPIRDLFAGLPDSRSRGYGPGRFSFNVRGGRCENCQGDGTIRIEMHFLPDVFVTCDVCGGRRYNRETLDVRYRGKNIAEVLDLSVEDALEFFLRIPGLRTRLETLKAVGLDYVKLGQSALTLSGGEAQRVKLALELSRRSTGRTFYILDEPTTGLHFADVKLLMAVLQQLVDKGNTVVLIEHNLDVIAQADWVIDLGPEGGEAGGRIVAEGTPEEIASRADSYTGRYLGEHMRRG
jgi:excinuclease ABC subunit A